MRPADPARLPLRPVIELLPVACAARGPRFIKSRVYAVSRDLRLRALAARLRVCVEDNRLFIGAPGPVHSRPRLIIALQFYFGIAAFYTNSDGLLSESLAAGVSIQPSGRP